MNDLISYASSLNNNLQEHSQQVLQKDLTNQKLREATLAFIQPVAQDFIRKGIAKIGSNIATKLGVKDLEKETLEKFVRGKIEEKLATPLKSVARALGTQGEEAGEDAVEKVDFGAFRQAVSEKLGQMGAEDLADIYNPATSTPLTEVAFKNTLDTLRAGDDEASQMADDLEEARSQFQTANAVSNVAQGASADVAEAGEDVAKAGVDIGENLAKSVAGNVAEKVGENVGEKVGENIAENLGKTAIEESAGSFLDFIPGLDIIGLALGIGGLVGGIKGAVDQTPIQEVNTASQFGVN